MKYACLLVLTVFPGLAGLTSTQALAGGETPPLTPREFYRDDSAFVVSNTRSHDINHMNHVGALARDFYFLPQPQSLLPNCEYGFQLYEVDMNGDSVVDFGGTTADPIRWQYPVPPVGEVGHEEITVTTYGLGNCGGYSATFEVHTLADPNITFRSQEGDAMTGYLSSDGVLDRPVLVVEGIDTTNETWPSRYLATLVPLMAQLPADYDLLVYNYADGGASVRENAMGVLGALLELESLGLPYDTRVIGISMGGVVARYALAYAEEHGLDHGCNLFVSADAPQQGAWLNVELQNYIKQLAELQEDNEVLSEFRQLLTSDSTLELVRENVYDPDYPAVRRHGTQNRSRGDEISGGRIYREFFQELNALNGDGYPKRTLNVGLSNGAGDIESRYLQAAARDNWIDQTPFARFKVFGYPALHLTMKEQDVYAGSYQPALKAAVTPGWEYLGFFIHFKIDWEMELTGAPTSFVWANSALDLWGIERSEQGEIGDVLNWDETRFDEIYINPATPEVWPSEHNAYHDDFGPVLADAVVAKLHEEPCYVSNVEVELTAPMVVGETRTVSAELSGRCIRDVEFYVSTNEGTTWRWIGSVPAADLEGGEDPIVEYEWQIDGEASDLCLVKAVGVPAGEAVSEPFSIAEGVGPNFGGTLVLHWDPSVVYTNGSESCGHDLIQACEQANAEIELGNDLGTEYLLHAFAAFPSSSRLAGVSFAVDYHHFLEVDDYGACADFEVTDSNWPDSGSGTTLTWEEPQAEDFVPVYWFNLYSAIGEFGHFATTRHPGSGGFFVDDSLPPVRQPIADYGVASNALWHVPCPEAAPADVGANPSGGPITDPVTDSAVDRVTLHCDQNPVRDRARFSREGAPQGVWSLRIYDSGGSLVRSEEIDGGHWTWDTRSAEGKDVPAGVYFASTDDPGTQPLKVSVVR